MSDILNGMPNLWAHEKELKKNIYDDRLITTRPEVKL